MTEPVFVVGATGRAGAALCRRLAAQGRPYVPVVRDALKWRTLGLPGERRVVELGDPRWIGDTLADARLLLSCAHARYTSALLGAVSEEAVFVLLGSFRRYAPEPDGDGLGVRAGEAAFLASGRRGAMLHPALLYGGAETRALAASLGRRRVLLLPRGGRVAVQPLHEDDLAEGMLSAADHRWAGPRVMALPGPERLTYAAFLRAVARAGGRTAPCILPLPAALGRSIHPAAAGMPDFDQEFGGEAATLLGLAPRPLAAGLAASFAAAPQALASRRS